MKFTAHGAEVEAFYFGLGGDDKYGYIANMYISSSWKL